MKKQSIALLGIIFSLLIMSLEIYLLKVIQCLDKMNGEWKSDPRGYLDEPVLSCPIMLTALVFMVSTIIYFKDKKK